MLADDLSALLARARSDSRVPSISAAVLLDGDIAWEQADGDGATPRHRYGIGSITKTFTAAAIMQLRDAGRLDLDEDVTTYLPDLRLGRASLRSLLSHRSGLGREVDVRAWEQLEFPAGAELLRRVGEQQRVLPYEERWKYSNVAYMLLGETIARVSGQSYRHYVTTRLLEPVGLGETAFSASAPLAQPYFVHPLTDERTPEPLLADRPGIEAPGGLFSTAADLCRWGAFLARPDPAILAPGTVEEMAVPRSIADLVGWRLGWGLGLMLRRTDAGILVGHAGGLPGFTAGLVVSREHATGAAVLVSASARLDAVGLAIRLTELALAGLPPRPEWEPSRTPPPADVLPLLGHWYAGDSQILLRWRDGSLEAEGTSWFDDEPPTRLERVASDTFRSVTGTERGELLQVIRDGDGIPTKLYWPYPYTREPRAYSSTQE